MGEIVPILIEGNPGNSLWKLILKKGLKKGCGARITLKNVTVRKSRTTL